MPYMVVTSWVPLGKIKEAVEVYIEVRKKFPPDRSLGKELIQGIAKIEGNKARTLTINEVKEGKLEEAILRQQEAMVMFHDIEGYEYSIDILLSFAETFVMIGKKAPE